MKELVTFDKREIGDTFLRIPPGTTKEQWNKIAERVIRVGHGYWWWLGDLANYARANFGNDKEIEIALEELCEAAGMSRVRLVHVADVAKKYAVKERISKLSFTHHTAACSLPPTKRSRILRRALKQSWTVNRVHLAANPRAHSTVNVIMSVPRKYVHSARFRADLKNFTNIWKVKRYYIAGTYSPRKKGRKPRNVPLLSVAS